MLHEYLIWLGELMYGNGQVSEPMFLASIIGAAIVATIPIIVALSPIVKNAFLRFVGLILFLPVFCLAFLVGQAAVVHEGRFSNCEIRPLTIEVNSTSLIAEGTYCRYRGETLDSEFGEWQLRSVEWRN
jgi:protein-S-isoprenylcysteine O-methyltransferase Ste14